MRRGALAGGEAAFTLLELMLALTLGLVLMVLIGPLLSASAALQGGINRGLDQQRQVQIVTAIVRRAVSQAGVVGCPGSRGNVALMLNGSWTTLPEFRMVPKVESARWEADASGRLDAWPVSGSSQPLFRYGGGIAPRKLVPGSDLLALRGYGQLLGHVVDASSDHFQIDLAPRAPNIRDGQILLVADCRQGAVFSATDVRQQDDLWVGWRGGGGTFDNAAQGVPMAMGLGSQAGVFLPTATFLYVAAGRAVTDRGTDTALWSKLAGGRPVEMVPYLADMQILYGVEVQNSAGEPLRGYFPWDEMPSGARVVILWLQFKSSLPSEEDALPGQPTYFQLSLSLF